MSFLNIAFPDASAISVAQFAIRAGFASIRPLIGLGLMASLLLIFKPLLSGVVRAIVLLAFPAKTREQRSALRNVRNMLAIRRAANDAAASPALAAELRALAARA